MTARVVRVFNNNAVLAQDHGAERVLMGRGIGFGVRRGDPVALAKVEQTFVLEPDGSSRLEQMLAGIPYEHIRVAALAAREAERLLGTEMGQANLVSLADHISFAARRVAQGLHVDYPLRWEIEQLYPGELAAATVMVQVVERELGIALPDGEPSALAMHLVNLQFAAPSMASALNMTQAISEVQSLLERGLGFSPSQDPLSFTRFVTHLRYLFVRLRQGRPVPAIGPELRTAISQAYGCHEDLARAAAQVIERHAHGRLTDDERAYLTLHIARLAQSARPGAGPV